MSPAPKTAREVRLLPDRHVVVDERLAGPGELVEVPAAEADALVAEGYAIAPEDAGEWNEQAAMRLSERQGLGGAWLDVKRLRAEAQERREKAVLAELERQRAVMVAEREREIAQTAHRESESDLIEREREANAASHHDPAPRDAPPVLPDEPASGRRTDRD